MNEEQLKTLLLLVKKEIFLSKLLAWLKGKGLYEQALKDLGVKLEEVK